MKHRLHYLDSLRGIAALAVALGHLLERSMVQGIGGIPAWLSAVLHTWFDFGKWGVGVFFCISGFVISLSLQAKAGDGRFVSLAKFWRSRFFRLYPAYWLSLALSLVFVSANYPWVQILANATMLQMFARQPDIVGVYWTLGIEYAFYLSCSALFVIGWFQRTTQRFWVAIAFLGVAVLFALMRFYLEKKVPVALPLALSLMYFGSIWKDYIALGERGARRWSVAYLLIFALALGPICWLAYDIDFGKGEVWTRYLVSYVLAVGTFVGWCLLRWEGSRLLVYLGLISYSLYLLHPLGLHLMETPALLAWYHTVGYPLYLAVYFAVIIAISALSYHFVERTSVDLGRRVALPIGFCNRLDAGMQRLWPRAKASVPSPSGE